eukprot:Nk52_evm23s239 gene=Nk52_evmTU23s239
MQFVKCFIVMALMLFAFQANMSTAAPTEEDVIQGYSLKSLEQMESMPKGISACSLCREAWKTIGKKITSDSTASDLDNFINKYICWAAKWFPISYPIDKEVCQGMVNLYTPQLMDILWNKGFENPDLVCGNLFHVCPKTTPPSKDWTIDLSGVPRSGNVSPSPKPVKGGKKTQLLHLSDVHYDRDYEVGATSDCGQPLCCRKGNKKGDPVKGTYAGKFGHPQCDVPRDTMMDMFRDSKKRQATHLIFTGDLVAHNIWQQTIEANDAVIENVTASIESEFPDVAKFPCIGNHEPAPLNLFAPSSAVLHSGESIKRLYKDLWDLWGPNGYKWIPADQKDTFTKGGFYSKEYDAEAKTKILTLNTNLNYVENWWLFVTNGDLDGQMKWLVDELYKAEQGGWKVYISAHVPPGNGDMDAVWSKNFATVVDRFADTILGQFYGHTHSDSFYVQPKFNDITKGASTAFVVGSVTTYQELNPGYRIFSLDGTNGAIADFTTYIANLEEGNKKGSLDWVEEYSATKDYGVKDCTPQSMLDFVYQKFDKDDDLVAKYVTYHTKSFKVVNSVDEKTLKATRCSVRGFIKGNSTFCDQSPSSNYQMLLEHEMFNKNHCSHL